MSSAGGALADGIPQLYFCHQCNRTVSVTLFPNADLLCPTCNGGFLEEYENPNPNPIPFPILHVDPFRTFPDPLSGSVGGLPLLLPRLPSTSAHLQNPRNQMYAHAQEPGSFDPVDFLQNYLGSLRAGGANIEFVIENNSNHSAIGDYFMGPGLEQLIQQLAENDPNRYGPPPAAKSAVESLPSIKVDDELMSSDLAQCAVCKDDFERGLEVKQLPCKHVYHSDCIIPWLEMHNSCPVCRHELPTDDSDYENRAREAASGNSNASLFGDSGGGSQANLQVRRTVERNFSISLPWIFGGFGSGSGSGGGGAGNSGGESNSGGRQ